MGIQAGVTAQDNKGCALPATLKDTCSFWPRRPLVLLRCSPQRGVAKQGRGPGRSVLKSLVFLHVRWNLRPVSSPLGGSVSPAVNMEALPPCPSYLGPAAPF